MPNITALGNTVVPAILVLETLGFSIATAEGSEQIVAVRGDERYIADDPVTVLGLIKLVEVRSWSWHAADEEIEHGLEKYPWLLGQ